MNCYLDNLATRGERLELLVDKTEDLEANVSMGELTGLLIIGFQ